MKKEEHLVLGLSSQNVVFCGKQQNSPIPFFFFLFLETILKQTFFFLENFILLETQHVEKGFHPCKTYRTCLFAKKVEFSFFRATDNFCEQKARHSILWWLCKKDLRGQMQTVQFCASVENLWCAILIEMVLMKREHFIQDTSQVIEFDTYATLELSCSICFNSELQTVIG